MKRRKTYILLAGSVLALGACEASESHLNCYSGKSSVAKPMSDSQVNHSAAPKCSDIKK